MNIKQAIQEASAQLKYASIRPTFEAELLMMHHLEVDRVYLVLHDMDSVRDLDTYQKLVARRASHEPMEYITKIVSFYDTQLYVDSSVLIPRPETEILVDKVSELVGAKGITTICEIGIGSGAISITLAQKHPHLSVIATDISSDAIKVASKNISSHNLQDKIKLIETSLLDNVSQNIELIVSNPPYIPLHTPLAPNVAEYEPHTALYSGENGDELLKEIIVIANTRGVRYLVCEMGYDQQKSISSFADSLDIKDIQFYKDYAGLDRGFVISFDKSDKQEIR